MLQGTDYEKSVFDALEGEVITNKEDQVMISTASKLFNEGKEEGREEGREAVALRMLQQGMELQLIPDFDGLNL